MIFDKNCLIPIIIGFAIVYFRVFSLEISFGFFLIFVGIYGIFISTI